LTRDAEPFAPETAQVQRDALINRLIKPRAVISIWRAASLDAAGSTWPDRNFDILWKIMFHLNPDRDRTPRRLASAGSG
jgi:hypothetical protein